MGFTACGHAPTPITEGCADTLMLHYAKGLTIIEHDSCTEVQITDPWHKGQLLQQYIIREPLSHVAIFTAANAALIDELGCLSSIAGVCEPEYIANKHILSAIQDTKMYEGSVNGTIRDLGSAMTPNSELIADLSPDAILLSPFENIGSYNSLDRLGIPLIWCADYMEPTALGRAEWMRFYGRLFGKGERADSLFMAIEQLYLSKRDSIAQAKRPLPTVLLDGRNGSAWYMPGGKSTLASLIADAGGTYLFKDNPSSGSVPYSFEDVYMKGHDADIWLFRYSSDRRMTLKDLQEEYAPYAQFKAFRTAHVYGCNNAENIFFEEYPFHPERILSDLTHIFSGDTCSLRYFHSMR